MLSLCVLAICCLLFLIVDEVLMIEAPHMSSEDVGKEEAREGIQVIH